MPRFATLTLRDFLEQVGAKTPAPGGGAVASAAGAIAAALTKMVVAYSVGKKSLAEHQPALEDAARMLERTAALLMDLADEDAAAYGLVNELSRLPENDPRRIRDYPAATAAAVQAPMATLAACCDLLRLVETLAPITNRHLRSDLAISAVLAEAAGRSAWWNVAVNLPQMGDGAQAARVREECRGMLEQAGGRRASGTTSSGSTTGN